MTSCFTVRFQIPKLFSSQSCMESSGVVYFLSFWVNWRINFSSINVIEEHFALLKAAVYLTKVEPLMIISKFMYLSIYSPPFNIHQLLLYSHRLDAYFRLSLQIAQPSEKRAYLAQRLKWGARLVGGGGTTAQAHKYVNNYKTTSTYLFKSIKPMNCWLGRTLVKISLQHNARAA